VIDYAYLRRHEDLVRLRHGVRAALDILGSGAFDPIRAAITDPAPADLSSDRDIDGWIRSHLATAVHMCSTCRMGPASDADAVVDPQCRVHGVEGLRVVDTSVMPRITSRGPSATAAMIGDRASAFFI
jgi:choline dehydrogenase-like flavoprotein